MYQCHAIAMNNERLDIEPMFQTEDEAWACVIQIMNHPTRPKMMWVTKGEDTDGDTDCDDNSCR